MVHDLYLHTRDRDYVMPHGSTEFVRVFDKKQREWDSYFMGMLPQIASKSKDPNTKVGAIIVGPDHAIRVTGYNGLVRGINDDVPERWSRENGEKYHWCEHAERNAIYSGARNGVALKDCTIYVSFMPCVDCARAIVQTGIDRVVVDRDIHHARCVQNDHWDESFERSRIHFDEAGVDLTWWGLGS